MNAVYTAEILLPVYKTLTHEMGLPDEYDNVVAYDEVVIPPKGVEEIKARARQVKSYFLAIFFCFWKKFLSYTC